MKIINLNIGIGVTKQLSLRVSVGALVKVLFVNPEDKKTMLALERTATLRQINGRREVIVKAKPFGGGIRIIDPKTFKEHIGEFQFDSDRSRQEKDFRIFVHPESWEKIKAICTDMKEIAKGYLDTSPHRELAEEFKDSLYTKLNKSQYELKPQGIVIEDLPGETDNVNAQGFPTVRIYYIFEAGINSYKIIKLILNNSRQYSDRDLEKLAIEDAEHGGKGRANSIFAVSLEDMKDIYHNISRNKLNELIRFNEHYLDGNVIAILDEIDHPKYKRFG